MRLIVAASTSWDRGDVIWQCLDILAARLAESGERYLTVVHGDTPPSKRGPSGDASASRWVTRAIKPAGIVVRQERHPARGRTWARNQRMADMGAGMMLAFQRGGSRGVADMIERAEKAEIVVKVVRYEDLGELFSDDLRAAA